MSREDVVQSDMKKIPNGEKVVGTFSKNEMSSRLNSLRGVMENL